MNKFVKQGKKDAPNVRRPSAEILIWEDMLERSVQVSISIYKPYLAVVFIMLSSIGKENETNIILWKIDIDVASITKSKIIACQAQHFYG